MTNPVSVGVVQLGARNHYLTARALHGAGMLHGLYTDAYARKGSWKTRLATALSAGNLDGARVLESRRSDLPDAKVKDAWSVTLRALLQRKLPIPGGSTARSDAALAKALTRFAIASDLASATAVFGYSSACPELFRSARRSGMTTLLDQASATVATSDRIMREEHKRWRGWALGRSQDLRLYEERQAEELDLADTIFAPSAFVKRSLLDAGVPEQRIEVIPYGFEVAVMDPASRKRSRGGRLRVLYLGNVSLQKGVPYLLEAARALGSRDFEYRVVGPVSLSAEKLEPYRELVQFTGRVPRNQTGEHYDWADVFVLPTLCDGFSVVQLEACARGVPVIATPSCGSIVEDGVQGYIVPPGDQVAIAERLQALRDSPTLLARMSLAASARAAEFSVEAYASRLVASLTARAG